VQKIKENHLKDGFLPCKLQRMPGNREFFAASSAKNPQFQQAPKARKEYHHA
jgi:hypothetical protein